jgi:DNA-binding FadR family transcriptional regulator
MLRERPFELSEFVRYLASHEANGSDTLPPLSELSAELGIGVPALREQLEVARALGFVEVRPRTGTRRLRYDFLPALRQSVGYAIALDEAYFETYADLRKHVEAAYWHEAVRLLTDEDKARLQDILSRAWRRLKGNPIQIPHEEHKHLHLAIFSRLNNPFVHGLLQAYWEAYEAVGLNVYTDYDYLQEVWRYHQRMVDAVCAGDFEAGHTALLEHTDLIHHRAEEELDRQSTQGQAE